MNLLEKYSWSNFPEDRLPTIEECLAAIKDPESAPWWIREYLRLRPEYEDSLRSMLDL